MDNAWKERLAAEANALGFPPSAAHVEALAGHVDLLLKWNAKVNLTRITEAREVRVKHVLDSIAALRVVPENRHSVLDFGAGAGFPGIPWAVMRGSMRVTLVDAVAKKVGFLKSAIAQLKLPARAHQARLQGDPVAEGLAQADLVVSRAFTAVPAFLALARPYLVPGGQVVALLGPRDREPEVRRVAEGAGYELVQFEAYELPEMMGGRAAARFVPRGTAPIPPSGDVSRQL